MGQRHEAVTRVRSDHLPRQLHCSAETARHLFVMGVETTLHAPHRRFELRANSCRSKSAALKDSGDDRDKRLKTREWYHVTFTWNIATGGTSTSQRQLRAKPSATARSDV